MHWESAHCFRRSLQRYAQFFQRGKQQRSCGIDAGIDAERSALVDVGFDVVRVKTLRRFTLRFRQRDFKDLVLGFQGVGLKRGDSIIHESEHIEMPFNEPDMGDAGIRQQHQPNPGVLESVQYWNNRIVQPEDIGGGVPELVDIQLLSGGFTELVIKLFFRDIASLKLPLAAFFQKKRLCLRKAPAAQLGNVLTHSFVRKEYEHIAHVEEAGFDCHGQHSRSLEMKSGMTLKNIMPV